MRKKKAFTLIELLVVIAIVGTLAGIVVINVNGARSKARDARRKSDLNAVSKAVDLYYLDNKQYPPGAYVNVNSSERWSGPPVPGWNIADIGLGSYLQVLPNDPLNKWIAKDAGAGPCLDASGQTFIYAFSTNKTPTGTKWVYNTLATRLENVSSDSPYYQATGITGPPNREPDEGCLKFANYAIKRGY